MYTDVKPCLCPQFIILTHNLLPARTRDKIILKTFVLFLMLYFCKVLSLFFKCLLKSFFNDILDLSLDRRGNYFRCKHRMQRIERGKVLGKVLKYLLMPWHPEKPSVLLPMRAIRPFLFLACLRMKMMHFVEDELGVFRFSNAFDCTRVRPTRRSDPHYASPPSLLTMLLLSFPIRKTILRDH